MIDFATRMVANYIKQKDISIKVISRCTNISNNILHRSLNKLVRPLRANEFLEICEFLKKNPNDFKKTHYF
jgi:DNA-binding Xre family transcriptional regulator